MTGSSESGRDAVLGHLRRQADWDVIVVGGGATGLGVAVDAAARGYRVLLLEAVDYAKATSSRSTKLIHGGVRYLEQGHVKLVYEALRERGILLRNAPTLVRPLPFLVPCYSGFETLWYGIGLGLYDKMAGRLRTGKTRRLDRRSALEGLPSLSARKLRGGILFYDAQFDDSRLAVLLLRNIQRLGGVAVNHCRVESFLWEDGRIRGVVARDAFSDADFELRAKVVVNATGPFADQIRRLEDPETRATLVLSRGSHLILPGTAVSGGIGLLIPKTRDGRVLFAIPWKDRMLVGTTDIPVAEPEWEPQPTAEEWDFLLEHLALYLPGTEKEPVLSAFAGLRPLAAGKADSRANTAAVSRDFMIEVSRGGLVSVLGGKWTTYRRMAEATVDRAAEVGGLPRRACRTSDMPLEWFPFAGRLGWDADPSWEPSEVATMVQERPELLEAFHPRLPYSRLAVVAAVRWEQAMTVEDVLARRTRSLLLDASAACEAAPEVANVMALEFGTDERWVETQVKEFQTLARRYTPPSTVGGDRVPSAGPGSPGGL